MSTTATKNLLTEALAHRFDEGAFRRLVQNTLHGAELLDEPHRSGNYVRHAFHGHVASFKRIAKYKDPEGDWLDVLAVKLKEGSKLDRARTMQRNFAADYLRGRTGRKPYAALVAYHADDAPDWRLSLVRIEYRAVETEDGRVKPEEVLSPARRYSFLVGEGEPSHTARQQLHALLDADEPPTVDAIEEAFSIERVTNDFFDAYKELFLALKEDLDEARENDSRIDAELERCNLTTQGFAKKLLGQLVFLYFLQKKGWLGVPRNDKWGDGPRNFLRRLFKKEYRDYDNFFDDCLEPLFYEALATERDKDGYYHPFDCRIPFLNGGLFEPPGGYAWNGVPLRIPDRTFRRVFDTFDRYNFTVREDEPLEKEVAVDPEMLGKVFENLLEVRDRKSKGAFYTPREIVSYMCNESLIQYLDEKVGEFGVPKADLEALVREGERWIENDLKVIAAGKETEAYSFAAPASIRENAAAVDAALHDITVCDPAIGSGAFPVGMMQAVVRVREALTPYLDGDAERTAYAFKRHAIEHSLYGVDIEPSAVDIARLRLWLSLVVDEDDYRTIQPLPNLRYKIVEGNSLVGFPENWKSPAFEEIERLKMEYVKEASPNRKDRLKRQIDQAIQERLDTSERTFGYRVDFDFRLFFSEVFHQNGGFDVVIGNPPYGKPEFDDPAGYLDTHYVHQNYQKDLYLLFLERYADLLKDKGQLGIIVSNTWLQSVMLKNIRRFMTSRYRWCRVMVNLDQAFDAVVDTHILLFEKHVQKSDEPGFVVIDVHENGTPRTSHTLPDELIRTDGWPINVISPEPVHRLMKRVEAQTRPLKEFANVKNGVKPFETGKGDPAQTRDIVKEKPFVHSGTKPDETWSPLLSGTYIGRYELLWQENYWIQYGPWLAAPRDPLIFETEQKIMMRQTGESLIGTLVGEGYIARNNVHLILPTETHLDTQYLLGLINSSLLGLAYHFLNPELGEVLAEVKAWHIKHLPIRPTDFDDSADRELHNRMIDLVEQMLQLHAQPESSAREREIAATDRQIDRLVYELYGLTEQEVGIVEGAIEDKV